MEKEIEKLIIDWNKNNSKLSSNSFWSTKTPLELIRFCLSVHKNIEVKSILISLNKKPEEFERIVLDIDKFKQALEYVYHHANVEKKKKEKYIYIGENGDVFDVRLERKLEYSKDEIIVSKIDQNIINESIIKEYKNGRFYYGEDSFKFILYQCFINDYNFKMIESFIELYKFDEEDEKFIFLSTLPNFFKTFFSFKTDIEKLEYWIETLFLNERFKAFEKYLNFDLKEYNEEIIIIYKNLHFKKILEHHNSALKKSINSNIFIEKEIQRFNLKLKTKPQFSSYSYREQKPSYYDTYNNLVIGNRDYFDNVSKKSRAGEVEAICDFIEYLENKKIKKQKNEVVKKYEELNLKDLLPIEIFENTRSYLKKIAIQVNTCYKNKAYDACAILLRKITEILIIESYEKEELEHKIKNSDGHPYTLKGLINSFINEKKFKKVLSRNAAEIFPKIKRNGDLSAHNRKYVSTKNDIDKLSDDFRILFQELINTIYH